MRKPPSPLGFGVPTIIMVVLALCLAIFTSLTLSTAKADYDLSQINAATVSAYYQADAQAAALYRDFCRGTANEYKSTLAISQTQQLYLHFIRSADNVPAIAAWQVISPDPFDDTESTLPVWTGE